MGRKENQQEEVTKAWQDREHAREYMANVGLTNNLPLFVRFYNGDQFPAATDRTKNMPRIVENVVRMICRNKKAAILSSPARISYKTEGEHGEENAEEFTRFSNYIQKELGQEALDETAVERGTIQGTSIYHYYWDAEARGKHGSIPGALRCELIDPLDAYFANPKQADEQKQKWIMFESREEVSTIREKADNDVDKELIVADEKDTPYDDQEQEGTDLVTVLTRYFRKNGEVYCEKSTRNVVVNKAYKLTPDVEEALREIKSSDAYADAEGKEDPANNALPDTGKRKGRDDKYAPKETCAYLYPVVVSHYERRNGSIYGISEVEGIIPAQKAINLTLSMIAYNVEMTAWPKYVVQKNALNGQKITNDPGQILTDFSGTGTGIRTLEGKQIPATAFNIVDMLTKMTRMTTGSTEVMTGETPGANMSGAAIAQLQSQAMLPIEDLKKNFWEAKRKQGRVLAQFFKLNYTNEYYTYEDTTDPKNPRTISATFDSAKYRNVEMDVVVETTAGSRSSVAGDIAALDLLLSRGAIDDYAYIYLYPDSAISNKSEILNKLKEIRESQIMQLQQQNGQMGQMIEQQNKALSEQSDVFSKAQSLIKENQQLQQALMELYVGSTEKLKKAGQALQYMASKNAEMNNDAQALAQNLAKSQGIL